MNRPSNGLSQEQRRGLRMAAQVACAVSLLAAGASLAHADAPAASDSDSVLDRTADLLRVRGAKSGCVPSWGPLAPPELAPELFARFVAEVA